VSSTDLDALTGLEAPTTIGEDAHGSISRVADLWLVLAVREG
jgi:hypothetical protein